MWSDFSGKAYDREGLAARIGALRWSSWKPAGIVLHNTAAPTLAQWAESGPKHAARIKNLQAYYEGKGWHGGPHWFVSRQFITEFNNPLRRGTHSPSFNGTHFGIEMVGDYDREAFDQGDGAAVRDNAVFLMALLCRKFGWDPSKVIKFHKEDPKTDHACPGKKVGKADIVARVRAALARLDGEVVGAGAPVDDEPDAALPPAPVASAVRTRMAKRIIDFEARRDSKGRLAVYRLPAGDQGGTYEVAGFNDRYHPTEAAELAGLIKSGRADVAEARACEYLLRDTAPAAGWTTDPGVEFMLRDSIHHRGSVGAAKILQRAVGTDQDGKVGPATEAAAAAMPPAILLPALRAAREAYEVATYGRRAQFWRGFTKRWDEALAFGLSLSGGDTLPQEGRVNRSAAVTTVPTPIALPDRPSVLGTLWGMLRRQPAPAPTPEATAAAARPGLAAGGDPQLYDLQDLLFRKGVVIVGRADGLNGPRTRAAIMSFRRENGLPVNDQIDDALYAAVAKADQQKVAPSRAEATAKDAGVDRFPGSGVAKEAGIFGGLSALAGIAGKLQESGMVDKITGTLDKVDQGADIITSTAATVGTVVVWIGTHWQLLAFVGGLYLILRAVRWSLGFAREIRDLFRQGIINR